MHGATLRAGAAAGLRLQRLVQRAAGGDLAASEGIRNRSGTGAPTARQSWRHAASYAAGRTARDPEGGEAKDGEGEGSGGEEGEGEGDGSGSAAWRASRGRVDRGWADTQGSGTSLCGDDLVLQYRAVLLNALLACRVVPALCLAATSDDALVALAAGALLRTIATQTVAVMPEAVASRSLAAPDLLQLAALSRTGEAPPGPPDAAGFFGKRFASSPDDREARVPHAPGTEFGLGWGASPR